MMNEKWEEQFREQIHGFVETIEKFDKGEIDRKAYKGISGGFGSYASMIRQSTCCVSEWQGGT